MARRLPTIFIALLLGLGQAVAQLLLPGVTEELARQRARQLSAISYDLSLTVPDRVADPVSGKAVIEFSLNRRADVVLDFQGTLGHAAQVNGRAARLTCADEHIVLPRRLLRAGRNVVRLQFTSADQALNRHDDYLYTLFVPDHARSCFPCFDQPDLKALFRLDLRLPEGWIAISSDSERPLPTYLFSFTAGKFNRVEAERDGRLLTVLHRETDTAKVAQLPIVFDQMALALRWLERYTGLQQPFSRYGAVVLPGYQFGGMEHPGAIQLNANTIFLPPNPTPDEVMNRQHLIAHETSHLWFGDLVTMRWFNDVWTKEVFANLMADKIAREQFPDVNHDLSFLKNHYPLALSTDRTPGTHPIQQPLDNLNQASLLYGNIIYHKAPIMMSKLEERMGPEAFRRGVQRYLRQFAYGNATWDDLIAIFDAEAPEADIPSFDREWVKQSGLRTIDGQAEPNADGRSYGHFVNVVVNDLDIADEACRYGRMLMLYDNWLTGVQQGSACLEVLMKCLENERNTLIASTCCSYIAAILNRQAQREDMEQRLYAMATSHPLTSVRQQLLRYLGVRATSPAVVTHIRTIWEEQSEPLLSERNYIDMAYHLAVLSPDDWRSILSRQRARLTNADRLREFDFVSRACNPSPEAQDSLFRSLADVSQRLVEPWVCDVLSLLNSRERSPQSERFIVPALEMLPYVQRTGGIFFPTNWLSALLSNHHGRRARQLIDDWLDMHPDLLPPLRRKVLEKAYYVDAP